MFRRCLMSCLVFAAVMTVADRAVAESPLHIGVEKSDANMGCCMTCTDVDEPRQITLLCQLCDESYDWMVLRDGFQPNGQLLPKNVMMWGGCQSTTKPLSFQPELLSAVAFLSPERQSQLTLTLLKGGHPLLSLKPVGMEKRTWVRRGFKGFRDCDGNLADMLDKMDLENRVEEALDLPCYEAVEIDERPVVEAEETPRDEPIFPTFKEDMWELRSGGFTMRSFERDQEEIALHPPAPLNSPNWVIPGHRRVALPFRPIAQPELAKVPCDNPIMPLYEEDEEDCARGPSYPRMPLDSPHWVIRGLLPIPLGFRPLPQPQTANPSATACVFNTPWQRTPFCESGPAATPLPTIKDLVRPALEELYRDYERKVREYREARAVRQHPTTVLED